MLTARQINLVQTSFAYVVPITDEAAAIFYAKLFALAPDTRPLFKNDMAPCFRPRAATTASAALNSPETATVRPKNIGRKRSLSDKSSVIVTAPPLCSQT